AAGRRLLPAGDASPELGGVTEAAEEPEVEREDLGLAGLAAIELAEEVLDAREDLLVGQPLRRELLDEAEDAPHLLDADEAREDTHVRVDEGRLREGLHRARSLRAITDEHEASRIERAREALPALARAP